MNFWFWKKKKPGKEFEEEMESNRNLGRDVIIMNLEEQLGIITDKKYKKTISECSDRELYYSILSLVKILMDVSLPISGEKKVYYISMEFLIGKLLSNNLINLGIYEKLSDILEKNGKRLSVIEEIEPEPSLGNGGLGRLAACFLDSIASLGLPGDGIGLNYHFGLFKQVFENNAQTAEKNDWIEDQSWLRKTNVSFKVKYADFEVVSKMYDIDVIGYENGVNKLHLFDVETVDEKLVKKGIDFDKKAIKKNLTLFLYPDDSDKDGNLLRIYQEYFMTANAARLILKEMSDKKYDLHELSKHAAIQINDTHPTLVIPELIRILVEEEHFSMDEAIKEVTATCAYTNHTILAEALETWPLDYLEEVVPHLIPYIKELDKRVKTSYKDPSVAIIDKDDKVHMAHIDIHYGHSINGVAAIHTNILKETELNNFYKIYPEKFNNKTNGITFRRWLIECNRELTSFLSETIGDSFTKNADDLQKLLDYKENDAVLDRIEEIKKLKKKQFADYVREKEGIELNTDSIFDIQAKRLHEYKRQQMNALYIINKYLEIKAGKKPVRPITFIFGAKAAPAYVIAQDIIHLILCLQELISGDPEVSPYIRVIMVENYNVSYAEKMIPACDVSEQISLASKEASGTGNMKFMVNGAVTLGTADGANVEIAELVGSDNIFEFGLKSDEVIEHYKKADYVSKDYYKKSKVIKAAVDFITGPELTKIGDKTRLKRLSDEILGKDWFMALIDLEDYIKVKDEAFAAYEDRRKWKQMMLVNIAKAGFFSSDRTIAQYNEDIWHLTK